MEKKYIITLKEQIFDGEKYTNVIYCDKVFRQDDVNKGLVEYKTGDDVFSVPIINFSGSCINVNYKP